MGLESEYGLDGHFTSQVAVKIFPGLQSLQGSTVEKFSAKPRHVVVGRIFFLISCWPVIGPRFLPFGSFQRGSLLYQSA